MRLTVTFVQLVNLFAVGALPLVFFKRDGRLNFLWWLTALPFFVAGAMLLLVSVGWLAPVVSIATPLGRGLALIGLALSLGSIALIAYTVGTHDRPIALWHQSNDAPEHVVTHGAYRYVRHPFYAAFLLGLLAVAVHIPHAATWAALVYALLVLTLTARKEERRLLASAFGETYRTYCSRTGRFLPKWGVRHA
jgi:protein-S-isoprenylcysteine O-methyltransferase Ste14